MSATLSRTEPFPTPAVMLKIMSRRNRLLDIFFFQMRPKQWATLSAPAKDLVMRMLDVNPVTRITVEQALEHPWIKVANSERN